MKTFLKVLPLCIASFAFGVPSSSPQEETLSLFENRRIAIAIPEGLTFTRTPDGSDTMGFRLSDAKDRISLDCVFLPDPEGDLASARGRREKLVEMFESYVGSSKEKGMQFEELEPRKGAGTYCVFTDASLIGKTQFPPGEYLHLTAGLKAWPGAVVVFRCFSNDTTSPQYQAVLKMLRESVEEKSVPLK